MTWLDHARAALNDLIDQVAQAFCRPIYMAGYAAGYGQGHFDGWAEHACREDDELERAEILGAGFLDVPPGAACRVCGCTQNHACVDERGPCWWVETDLCSHCDEPAAGKAVG